MSQELRRCGLSRPRAPKEKVNVMEYLNEIKRGQAGRDAALRFARRLKRQGFWPTSHFVERFMQRVLARGLRFDSRAFRREFFAARHYRQTRPGYRTRIAIVRGVPVLYRRGGWNGERIVLVGVLPVGARPPVAPVGAPSLEALLEAGGKPLTYAEQMAQYRSCINAYAPLPGKKLPTGPGKAFRAAFREPRQQYLSCQHLNPDQPRFMRGWHKQEQRRLKNLQAQKTPHKQYLRGVPGYDVGHPLGRVKGTKIPLKSLNDPRTFRTEMATQNRRRPTTAKKLKMPWAFWESEPWA